MLYEVVTPVGEARQVFGDPVQRLRLTWVERPALVYRYGVRQIVALPSQKWPEPQTRQGSFTANTLRYRAHVDETAPAFRPRSTRGSPPLAPTSVDDAEWTDVALSREL